MNWLKKFFLLSVVFFFLGSLPIFASNTGAVEMAKMHFKPFGITLKEANNFLSGSLWLKWQALYLAKRTEIKIKTQVDLKEKSYLSLNEALSAYQLKKESLNLPQSFFEKPFLTEEDGLLLLRRIDTIYGYPDVLVYGSELESISAGISAKKEGLEVVLLHEKPKIGGLAVDGALNYIDLPESDGKSLLQGFAQAFYKNMGNAYDLEKARGWLKNSLTKNNIIVKQAMPIKGIRLLNGEIKSISFLDKTYFPKIVIDASENGDFLPLVGAKFSKGLYENEEIYPGASLLYILEGVDYKRVGQFLNKRAKEQGLFEGSLNATAWGYKKEMAAYKPQDRANVVRGLNIAYIKEKDKVVINHIFNTEINPFSAMNQASVTERLKREVRFLVPYLQTHLVGFEKAKLVGFANELYIRDSRHFKGSYVLTLEDIINRQAFFDSVVITNYPVDIHGTKKRKENIILYYPQSYEIPYRIMHDDVHKNFLVTGKCASYAPLAAGSTRIIMTGTMVSEVGGIAASLAIREHKPVQKISIIALQEKLRQRGFIDHHFSSLKRRLGRDELRLLESGEITYDEMLKERVALNNFFIGSEKQKNKKKHSMSAFFY